MPPSRVERSTQIYPDFPLDGPPRGDRMPSERPAPTGAELLALGPASRLVGVDPDTLRRWADDGRVEVSMTPGGHRRFHRRSLERLLRAGSDERATLARLGGTPQ